jgi:hypothetical protein
MRRDADAPDDRIAVPVILVDHYVFGPLALEENFRRAVVVEIAGRCVVCRIAWGAVANRCLDVKTVAVPTIDIESIRALVRDEKLVLLVLVKIVDIADIKAIGRDWAPPEAVPVC